MGLHAAPSEACMIIKLDLEVTLKLVEESLVGLGGTQQAGSDGHQGNMPVHCHQVPSRMLVSPSA